MQKITNILLAISTFAHQIHLNFTDYGDHLLADKLREDLDNDIDRLKELAMANTPSISTAAGSLLGAAELLKDIPTNLATIAEGFNYLLQLEAECVRLIQAEIQNTDSEGVKNALADVCEKRLRHIYLLSNRIKQ